MYYITNHNGQVIAASSDLLKALEVESIDALYKQMALDAITFTPENGSITLKTPLNETQYQAEEEKLSSLLGNMTLVRLIAKTSTANAIEERESILLPETENEIPVSDDFSLMDDEELFTAKEKSEEIQESKTEKSKEDDFSLLDDEELFGIKEEHEEGPSDLLTEPAVSKEEEEDLFDLILPSSAEETIGEIKDEKVMPDTPLYIDVEQISQSIGISPDDYNTFLTEYIDTALSLENDLRSSDQNKRTAATHTLFHLSNVLRLPVITEIIEQLKYTEAEDIDSSIKSFYDTLSRLTTSKPETTEKAENKITIDREASDTTENSESFGTIDLSDVKPIHFDFRVEEAANELSLPAELIEEFIHDFIKQAHEETDKMLQAYEKGDLDTIQKIGHLLKGTASNLRINPLSDTLYEIQFCDDPSKLEALIKEYWAHFIAFETQFNLQSQH